MCNKGNSQQNAKAIYGSYKCNYSNRFWSTDNYGERVYTDVNKQTHISKLKIGEYQIIDIVSKYVLTK